MVSDACHWACILQVMYDNLVIISSVLSFVAECRTNCAVISLAMTPRLGFANENFAGPQNQYDLAYLRLGIDYKTKLHPFHCFKRDDDIFRSSLFSFKGRFFLNFISGLLWTKCYQRCQHVSKLHCTKCL